jgi:arylsulfatase A-like enzyme
VAGLKPKKGIPLDGESLIPILKGDTGLKRKSLFFHYPNYAFHKRNRLGGVVRCGNYKLIHFYDDDSIELYDVVADQGEKKNLARTKVKLAANLKNELAKWLKKSGAKMPFVPEKKSNL